MTESLKEGIARVLQENGVDSNPDSALHSWRCRYPVHGQAPCTCFDELVEDLKAMVEQHEQ